MEDMKGKIRVYCRVRPVLQMELDRGQTGAEGGWGAPGLAGLGWGGWPHCLLPACPPTWCQPRLHRPRPPAEAVMIPDELTIALNWKGQKREWSFDAVFGATTHQDRVFEDTKHLIQSAVDGYNVCIFACEGRGRGRGGAGRAGAAGLQGGSSCAAEPCLPPFPPSPCPPPLPSPQTARRAAARPSPSTATRRCRA